MNSSLSIDQLLGMKALGGSEAPAWSPDGRLLAWVSPLGGTAAIWAAAPDSGLLTRLSTTAVAGGGLLTAYQLQWAPNGAFLAYISDASGADELWLWHADGSGERQLTALGARIEAFSWAPDSQHLVLASNVAGSFDIYQVAVADGRATRLTHDARYEVYPTVTPDGRRILYTRLDACWVDHEVVSMARDGSDARVVLEDHDFFDYHYGRSFGYPRVSADGQHFVFRSQRSGWTNVWLGRVDGTDAARPVAAAAADQSDPVFSPDGRQVAYSENHHGTSVLKVAGVEGGRVRTIVAPELGVCAAPWWAPDGTRLAFLLGTPTSPNDLWVVELESGHAWPLTRSVLGGGVDERLVVPKKISYATWDERTIEGYLYAPAGAAQGAERYPGILWIHGGPTNQFMDSYQAQVQYFVQQGYVVLLPNIRGSSGYGRAFEDLNNGDWGHGDLKDVLAGADYLKTLSSVDGAHLGITGTSYGGIMSMAAVAFAPGAFQAAIACSGYGDFLHMADHEELRHVKLLEFELGMLPEDEHVYRRCSPIYSVEQATTPCFVLHGEGMYPGSRAGIEFALALERAYKPFWYKAYPGEFYYVRSTQNVRRMLLDMRAFFDQFLKGIPHNLPNDGNRPLTHLSGVVGSGNA